MEEKCIHHNIDMELSKEKEGAYHIDINTFNNNQKNKIYNINNDRNTLCYNEYQGSMQ